MGPNNRMRHHAVQAPAGMSGRAAEPRPTETVLEAEKLTKIYTTRFGGSKVKALDGVTFTVRRGEMLAVMGESGSGKTTLLNILAGLDRPTGGAVRLMGGDMTAIPEGRMAAFRRENIGFVFQDFSLLDTFSIADNIFLPLVLSGKRYAEMRVRLIPIARALGIEEILEKYPYEVSGGQKQRAAVARALITEPRIILADEPTGALDSKSADELLELLTEINAQGRTILMVTHSARAASRAGRVLFLRDGRVFGSLRRGEMGREEYRRAIDEALAAVTGGGSL